MKKKILSILFMCAVMLSACVEEENHIAEVETVSVSASETDSEKISEENKETVAEENSETEDMTAKPSEYMDENDFYISVTDYTGAEKYLYYDTYSDGTADFYMTDPTYDPESSFGYMPVIPQDEPANKNDIYFGEKLIELAERSELAESAISYAIYGNDRDNSISALSGKTGPSRADNKEEFTELLKLISELDPEYIEDENIENDESFGLYSRRYPLMELNIFRKKLSFSSSVNISFSMYGERPAARITVYDYSELVKLLLSGKEKLSEDEVRGAYEKSEYLESGWFYADEYGLYDILLKWVIMSEKNNLDGVRQLRTEKIINDGFSSEVSEYINTDVSSLENYTEYSYKEIKFKLPDYAEYKSISDVMGIWETDDKIRFRINSDFTDTGENTKKIGKFYSNSVYYLNSYDEKSKTYTDAISIKDLSGNRYQLKFEYFSENRTEEYDALVKNVFGSVSLAAVPQKDNEISGTELGLSISAEPSNISDSDYLLAEGYIPGVEEAVPEFENFYDLSYLILYALDWNKEYETKWESHLERLEPDGNWHEVLPLSPLPENKEVCRFENVLDEKNTAYGFKNWLYPPLPVGRYRIAIPFWEKGQSDAEIHSAMFEFKISNPT